MIIISLQVIAGATTDLNPKNHQISRVEETKIPKDLNQDKPIGNDIMLLILKEGFELEPCKIESMALPSLNYKPTGL